MFLSVLNFLPEHLHVPLKPCHQLCEVLYRRHIVVLQSWWCLMGPLRHLCVVKTLKSWSRQVYILYLIIFDKKIC